MIPLTHEEQKKEAFRLFEDGRYRESLELCTQLCEHAREPAIEVLAATNLFYAGRLEEAEVFFLDLAQKMPDSSYVHSYLAKVFEARGDERATAEYALAVHRDPTNQDALRSYAEYLLSRADYRGAVPVLKQLVRQGRKDADLKNLMRALIGIGEPHEALRIHAAAGPGGARCREYVEALCRTTDDRAAAEAAGALFRETRDPAVLRIFLEALSRTDRAAAREAYAEYTRDQPDPGIVGDYVLLLMSQQAYDPALALIRTLLARTPEPAYRLLECEVLSAAGEEADAMDAYERLIRDESGSKNDPDVLGSIISRYRAFLTRQYPAPEALPRFLRVVSRDVTSAGLRETARFYEDLGNHDEARAWFYRGYRADFLNGGIEYAKFLLQHGDERECEKVLLYILSNVKKTADLVRVAAAVVDAKGVAFPMRRLREQLIGKLEDHRQMLSADGRELLAASYAVAARTALDGMDYGACKHYCLCGMDVLPQYSRRITLEEFLGLIRTCKEDSVADRPVMDATPEREKKEAPPALPAMTGELGLSDQEQRILGFLRSHRRATEMDLRMVLGTRRAAGIVNRLIQKAGAQGISLIEKKGVGEHGETYEYTGT